MTRFARPADAPAFATAALALMLACPAGAESLADLPPFREGSEALAEGRYETASARFLETWRVLRDGEAGDTEKNLVAARLLEALVRDGHPGRAAAWAAENDDFRPSGRSLRWMARAHYEAGGFAEAAVLLRRLEESLPGPDRDLSVRLAVSLARAGRASEGHERLRNLAPGSREEARLFARIALLAEEPAAALDHLAAGVEFGEDAGGAASGEEARLRTLALARSGRLDEAHGAAAAWLAVERDPREMHRGLLLLEEIGSAPPRETLAGVLERWREDGASAQAGAARLFEILFLDGAPDLGGALSRFLEESPEEPWAAEARLRIHQLEHSGEDWLESTPGAEMDDSLRSRIDFAAAAAAHRGGRFEEAVERFLEMAKRHRGEERARSLYNAAAAALQAGRADAFTAIREDLAREDPRSPWLAELEYLSGLGLAAEGDARAVEALTRFARDHPDHPRNSAALLALAEIHLNQAPARPQAAREILEELRARSLDLEQAERLDYNALWAEAIDEDSTALVRRAEEFLKRWPGSGFLCEVAMLLATEFYGMNNPEAAKTRFEWVAANFPASPFADAAAFFAAKCAPRRSGAEQRWRALVAEGGALAAEARHELGLLLLSMDRFEEAREQFALLAGEVEPASPIRFAALADTAFAYYAEALAAGRDPALLGPASEAFARVVNISEAPAHWRYNAAVRRGKCLEAMGNDSVALEIYRSIVEESLRSGSRGSGEAGRREAEWVFRAGFSAIGILSRNEEWGAAIRMADALSETRGPRSIEAARLAEELRLRHWIWD